MASSTNTKQNKSRTPKKRTSASSRSKAAAKNTKSGSGIIREAAVLITVAFAIIIFITNFGVGGVVGRAVSSFFFGIFGLTAYVFPILLIAGVMLGISNYKNSVIRIKLIAAVFILLLICTLIQLISGSHASEWKFTDYYLNSSAHKNGGGFFGGSLCKLLCMGFGTVGAWILDIVLIIICVVIISEHSFISGLKKGSKKVYDTARNDAMEYRENAEERRRIREEARLERASRKVKGVALDTEIPKEELPKEDVYSFEAAPAAEDSNRRNFDGDILPFDSDTYGSANDVTEFAARHYEEEQSSPFDSYTGEEEYGNRDEGAIDTDLVRSEFEKEELTRQNNHKPASFDNVPYKPVYEHAEPADSPVADTEDYSESHYIEQGTEGMAPVEEFVKVEPKVKPKKPARYFYPPVSLLKQGDKNATGTGKEELKVTAGKLQQTLANFGVKVTVTDVSCGPSVTRYEIQPEQGVKVSKIVSLADDIKLNLAAADIRIEAPIPGKAAVGIEVPNKTNTGVMLGDLIRSREFKANPSKIAFAAGMDIAGQPVLADIAKMPHLLIAGATGSGKSVCINTIIMSILYRARPDEVKLIMVDPKVVELSVYNGIPHLLIPVVTDPKKAAAALAWAVSEMTDRYNKFAEFGVRDMKGYNEKVESVAGIDDPNKPDKLPQIVIIIDELADLMMVSSNEVEDAIVRLAQLARAAGIHLVIATQRPSVNVITGLIKANVPSRIAFSVSSGVDSRTILDMYGAEKLLGKGDMLFYPQGYQKPARVQGAFVSDEEVSAVVEFLKSHCDGAEYSEAVTSHISNPGFEESKAFGEDRDQYFAEAGRFIIEKERASIGMLQRVYKIGFNRAARIMDQLAEAGVVGPEEGTKPRKVLMTMDEFNNYLNN
ncbi:MAG: DNA translocase FtsK 4TM domain-containing protein [Butyrivibrio sp.]